MSYMKPNESITQMSPYKVSSHKAWETNVEEFTLKLDWNEAVIGPSPKVLEAIGRIINTGRLNWYPDTNNIELLNLIAEYCTLPVENVDYYASSDALHEYIARAYLSKGDAVLIMGPTYDNFRAVAESQGAQLIHVDALEESNFTPPLLEFDKALSNYYPRVAYICNPNNPTGRLIETKIISDFVKKYKNTLFVVDEAYFEFCGKTSSQLVREYGNIILCRTFSKAFALASFRIGYALASGDIIRSLRKIRNTKNVSLFAQVAVVAALNDVAYTQKYVNEVSAGRDFLMRWALARGWRPLQSNANFVLVTFGEMQSELVQYLEARNVYLRNFNHIDVIKKYTRITIGTPCHMRQLTELIDTFCAAQSARK